AFGADQHQAVAAHLVAAAGGEEAVALVAVLGDPHAPFDHLDRQAARAAQPEETPVLEREIHATSVGRGHAPATDSRPVNCAPYRTRGERLLWSARRRTVSGRGTEAQYRLSSRMLMLETAPL